MNDLDLSNQKFLIEELPKNTRNDMAYCIEIPDKNIITVDKNYYMILNEPKYLEDLKMIVYSGENKKSDEDAVVNEIDARHSNNYNNLFQLFKQNSKKPKLRLILILIAFFALITLILSVVNVIKKDCLKCSINLLKKEY